MMVGAASKRPGLTRKEAPKEKSSFCIRSSSSLKLNWPKVSIDTASEPFSLSVKQSEQGMSCPVQKQSEQGMSCPVQKQSQQGMSCPVQKQSQQGMSCPVQKQSQQGMSCPVQKKSQQRMSCPV
ncbi:hypothetical protein BgiMline_018007 [Biomphalaria glabrata]